MSTHVKKREQKFTEEGYKQVEYISPSALALWRQSKEGYYKQYLSPKKRMREPQTPAMAIGSSFDAYVKNYLHQTLLGKNHRDSAMFEFTTIFEAQVEDNPASDGTRGMRLRDWAKLHGQALFNQYQKTGALAALLEELNGCIGEPRFESELLGVVNGRSELVEGSIGGVHLLGRPDIYFVSRGGAQVIFDLKVNGYCSASPVSPLQGYTRIHPGNTSHPNCVLAEYQGIRVNHAITLDQIKPDWAAQLSIYAWLCGTEVGDKFIAGIDQVACRDQHLPVPSVRFAAHRVFVKREFQHQLFKDAAELWRLVNTKPLHIFQNLPLEASQSRCRLLDSQDVDDDPVFAEMTRRRR